jgi:hypothetical protein
VFHTNVPNDFVDALSNDLETLQAFFRLPNWPEVRPLYLQSDLAGSEAGSADIDGDPLTEMALQAAGLKAAAQNCWDLVY